ncbi:MAG TPA: hypothetical protein VIM65_06715 [Cyclobacteriaceae bacterium]
MDKKQKIKILKYGLGYCLLFGIAVGLVVRFLPEYKIWAFAMAWILLMIALVKAISGNRVAKK